MQTGELAAQSVPFVGHRGGRGGRSRHHSQVRRGKRSAFCTSGSFLVLRTPHLPRLSCPGGGQHDRVGQRCDWQRRPALRHRAPAHGGGRGNPEALAGPLTSCGPASAWTCWGGGGRRGWVGPVWIPSDIRWGSNLRVSSQRRMADHGIQDWSEEKNCRNIPEKILCRFNHSWRLTELIVKVWLFFLPLNLV